MGILDGLALGLSRVGVGVSQGELTGQQRQLQQIQLQRQLDFRNAQLAAMTQYRGGQLGLRAAQLQQRGQLPYIHALADPHMAGYFARNPGDLAIWQARAGLTGVDPSTLPADPHMDPTTGTLRAPTGQTFGPDGEVSGPAGSTTPSPSASSPSPPEPPAPPPSLSLPNSISGVGSAGAAPPGPSLQMPGTLAGVGQGPAGPTAPPLMSDTSLSTPAPVANLGRPPAFALGNVTPHPTPIGPPIPANLVNRGILADVRNAGTNPAPPVDMSAVPDTTDTAPQLGQHDPTRDPNNPLFLGYLPHEDDRARAQRIAGASKAIASVIGTDRFRAEYPGIVASGLLKGLKLEAYPTEETAKITGMNASTTLKQAQTKALQDYTPLKNQFINSQIAHVKTADDLAALRAQIDAAYKDQLIALGNRRADIAAAAQTSTAGVNSARVAQINQAISQSAGSKDDATDRSILQNGLKALTSQKRTPSGASVPFLSPADQATWQGRVDAALARMQARQTARAGGTATSPSTVPTAGGTANNGVPGSPQWKGNIKALSAQPGTVMTRPTAGAGTGASIAKPVRVSPEVQNLVGQLINSHRFDAEMALPDYQDPARRMLMKRAFLQVTGRNWTGGK